MKAADSHEIDKRHDRAARCGGGGGAATAARSSIRMTIGLAGSAGQPVGYGGGSATNMGADAPAGIGRGRGC